MLLVQLPWSLAAYSIGYRHCWKLKQGGGAWEMKKRWTKCTKSWVQMEAAIGSCKRWRGRGRRWKRSAPQAQEENDAIRSWGTTVAFTAHWHLFGSGTARGGVCINSLAYSCVSSKTETEEKRNWGLFLSATVGCVSRLNYSLTVERLDLLSEGIPSLMNNECLDPSVNELAPETLLIITPQIGRASCRERVFLVV